MLLVNYSIFAIAFLYVEIYPKREWGAQKGRVIIIYHY